MCRSIKTLRPPYTDDVGPQDMEAAALQYVRKIAGMRQPSKANQDAFNEAVRQVAAATDQLLGQLGERALEHLDVVGSGVRAGVARPQQTRQRLLASRLVAEQRVEAEAALVRPGRALLVGVSGDQGGVEVEDHALGCACQLPHPSAGAGARRPDRLQTPLVEHGEYPPSGRIRGNLAEQARLVAQRAQVGQAVAAVGEHYRELIDSGAFLRADRFEEVVAGIELCLAQPTELADERRRVVQAVVGLVDGHAAERVVEAVAGVIDA